MQPTETTVSRSGHTIAYRDSDGTGSVVAHPVPVIMVHGMGGDNRTWDRFARAVTAQGRRVLAVDLRGHGRSARAESYLFGEFGDDILGLCEDLGFDSVDLVGHSLGGHAVSLVAQQRPALVRRLVLEEAPLPLRPGDPVPNFGGRLPSPVELWHAATRVDPVLLESAVDAIGDCEVVSFACGHSIHRDRYRDFESAVLPFLMAP
ncbi:alpha/beta fold hydrolase [Prescottella agglutinans]|uniref:alpha/beta fold hydrolase n=1 Tax=Prescottella agglutinans TaxID=1644129 RepID=UPI003D9535A6